MTAEAASRTPDPRRVPRQLPELTVLNEFFWKSGADGKLRILCCEGCGYYVHPPAPRCARCHARDVAPKVLSGRGVVHSYTVNHHAWTEGSEPYVIALVELCEQEGLRLTTNLVDCPLDAVQIGMVVQVVFEPWEDLFLPLFRPVEP